MPKQSPSDFRKACAARGYVVLPSNRVWLAVDENVLSSSPDGISARMVEFFARNGFERARIGDLPPVAREAMLDLVTRSIPGLSRAEARDRTMGLQPTGVLTLKFPPGLGKDRRAYPEVPRSALPVRPRNDPSPQKTAIAEADEAPWSLRMFASDRGNARDVLDLWRAAQPAYDRLVAERRDLDQGITGAYSRAAQDWMERALGGRKGETRAFSRMSPEARDLVSRGAQTPKDALEDAQISIGQSKLFVVYPLGEKGTAMAELAIVGENRVAPPP